MFAVVDIETTGSQPPADRITEIAIVLYDGANVVDRYHSLVNPERSIPPMVTQLTGITQAMVADAPRFFQIAKQVVEFTEGQIFVAHNVSFDYAFLRAAFSELGYTFQRQTLDTVKLSRQLAPGLPSYSLGRLCQSLGIPVTKRHRADGDAEATTALLDYLLRGQRADAGNMVNAPSHASATSLGIFKSKLWDLTLTADDHLDALLNYMEQRVKLKDTAFNLWKMADAFLRGKADLFRSTDELQQYHNIGNSRRTYLALLPYIRDAARLYVMPQVGQDMYNELVQQLANNAINTANAILLDYVRPALVKYALMCAADADGLNFDFDAPRVVSNPDGMDTRAQTVANRLRVRQNFRITIENVAKQYLTDLTNYLNANLDIYPTYKNQLPDSNDRINTSKIVVSRDDCGRVMGGIGIF